MEIKTLCASKAGFKDKSTEELGSSESSRNQGRCYVYLLKLYPLGLAFVWRWGSNLLPSKRMHHRDVCPGAVGVIVKLEKVGLSIRTKGKGLVEEKTRLGCVERS